MTEISGYVIPVMILAVLALGLLTGDNLFETFLEGAADGFKVSVKILPSIVGLLCAISMLKASGALDIISFGLEPVGRFFGLPKEVMPLAILRPISGSGGIALLENILKDSGPDSYAGRIASVIAGATETTFYTIAIYYGAVSIKKTRHTIPAAISADLAGIIMSAVAVRLFIGI